MQLNACGTRIAAALLVVAGACVGINAWADAAAPASAAQAAAACIPAIAYLPLDARQVGQDDNGVAALGTYERISPDGRFVLRSYSGARLGQVSLIELPADGAQAIKVYRTPLSNEAFPVQGSWRYLVDVNGQHYRLGDVLRLQTQARPLFRAGMTGFYAAAAELAAGAAAPAPADNRGGAQQPPALPAAVAPRTSPPPARHTAPPAPAPAAASATAASTIPPAEGAGDGVHKGVHDSTGNGGAVFFIRSLSWPQNADPDSQGVGPLQIDTIAVQDDGRSARVLRSSGAQYICGQRAAVDGNVYALPMLSVEGAEFSAIPQTPASGTPSMRVYGLSPQPMADSHACDLRSDLGLSPGKAVFGYAQGRAPAWLTYSDLGYVYVHERQSGRSFRLDHARGKVLASAFPALTRDGRVIYGATWQDCPPGGACQPQAGYVVADPYQSQSYRAYWREKGAPPPKACITRQEVAAERARFAQERGLPP